MQWIWELKDWPEFRFDESKLEQLEHKFLLQAGKFQGILEHCSEADQSKLKIKLLRDEALKTSEIEGELLDRDSLQSSLQKNFGLKGKNIKPSQNEEDIAELMTDLYHHYKQKLSHKKLKYWYSLITGDKENYRSSQDAMQVVSGSMHKPKVHFEAPPSSQIKKEMDGFIQWFNSYSGPALIKAGIAHLYFVTIHPFEDGNGRIARALAEKSLSQVLDRASLISLSLVIEKNRKQYYRSLQNSNHSLDITNWLVYFAETIIEAQEYSQSLIEFTLRKSRFYDQHQEQLNARQTKVIHRILDEGPNGFEGGLSVSNYIAITKTSRATATRDLQDLLEKKIVRKTGELKSTRYYLNL